MKKGRWVTSDYKPGVVLLFDFGHDGDPDHVGIFDHYEAGKLVSIEGNTSITSNDHGGAVMERSRAKSVIIGAYMPEDHMGDEKDWAFATETLETAVKEMGKDYVINEGDGAFYGPKLDFHLADSLGRTWQCGTIQLDMQLPERFELEYTGADGEKHRPVMIHRVVFGSIERFIGVITEHFAGAFPVWLSPVQVKILTVTDRADDYAAELKKALEGAGLRVECDLRNEKIGKKIREAQLEKLPYMLVVGDRDIENGTVSVRTRSGEDLGAMPLTQFQSRILEEVETKAL